LVALAVAALEITNVVALVIELMIVFAGIPVPEIPIPADKVVVEAVVTVVVELVVQERVDVDVNVGAAASSEKVVPPSVDL
jgi:hypothetical protein